MYSSQSEASIPNSFSSRLRVRFSGVSIPATRILSDLQIPKPKSKVTSIDVYVTAVIDFNNEHPELVETSFEYVPSEFPDDEPIQDYTDLSGPLSEGQLKVLTQWLKAIRNNQNDWYPTDDINLLQEYS